MWVDLQMRTDELKGSRTVSREFAGKVKQLITGSTGLDDAEWGVTLFARDTFQIKAIVYKMRFDPVSTEYADFRRVLHRYSVAARRIVPTIATLVFTRAPDRTRNRSNHARLRLRARAGIKTGWLTERSIVHAWKACVPKGSRGSNPRPSAMLIVGSVWIDSAIHAEK
jgi:Chlorite dismutase